MADPPIDVHQMDSDVFRDRVRSFEFWFEAVQGYLEGSEYGHRPETAEGEFSDEERDRLVTVLCNYCVGEAAALDASGGLIQIAPNRASKVFLSTQTVDEGRHLEVFTHRLHELGVVDVEQEIDRRASPSLQSFKAKLLDLVNAGDWMAGIFAQNVILEAMEFAVFQSHVRDADPRTREVLIGVVKDERRHIGFGENELGRRLKEAPELRPRLAIVRQELDHLVFETFEDTMQAVKTPADEKEELGRNYREAVERLGFA